MKKILVPIILIMVMSVIFIGACTSQAPAPTTSAPVAPPTTSVSSPLAATSPTTATKTLDIGEIESLSGIFSDFMKYMPQAAQVAKDYINNHGGITINGQQYMINLVLDDNKSAPDASASAANDLIFDKHLSFICGTGPTPLVIAIDQVTEQAGVLYTGQYQNGTPDEMGPKHPLKFVGSNCSFSAQYTAMQYLKQIHPEVKTIAFIQSDDGQIQYDEPVLQALAGKLGLTIQGAIIGQLLTTVDFTPICQTAVSRNADAIMLGNMPTGSIGQDLQGIRALGYTKPILDGSYSVMPDVIAVAGKANAEGFFGLGIPADPNIPGLPPITKEVVQATIAKYGTFNDLDIQGFDQVYTVVQAIQAAQSLDPKVVAATWEKMTAIDTIFGPGKMGGLQTYGVNHNVYFPTPIQTIVNGSIQFNTWIPLAQSAMP